MPLDILLRRDIQLALQKDAITADMIGRNVDLLELNLLALRLTMLGEDDRMGLDGLLQIEKENHTAPFPLSRLINLTFNADICLLAPQVSNTQELGALLYEGEMLSEEAMALVDTMEEDGSFRERLLELLGEQHQEEHSGVFTSRGYAEPGSDFKEVYRKGEMFCFARPSAPVVLEVRKGFFDDPSYDNDKTTIADVKAYKPENKSIVSGQVLQCPYDFKKARLVVREMADALALDLVDKGLVTNQLVLTVGYDRENLDGPSRRQSYRGPVTTDRYGRKIPKHAVGTENFPYTSSASDLLKAVSALYDRIVDENLLIRRLSISANKLLPEVDVPKDEAEQLDLFTDYAAKEQQEQADEAAHARERKIQEAMLGIKKKFGKNAILKGMNLEEGATARERNQTIGGHHE